MSIPKSQLKTLKVLSEMKILTGLLKSQKKIGANLTGQRKKETDLFKTEKMILTDLLTKLKKIGAD